MPCPGTDTHLRACPKHQHNSRYSQDTAEVLLTPSGGRGRTRSCTPEIPLCGSYVKPAHRRHWNGDDLEGLFLSNTLLWHTQALPSCQLRDRAQHTACVPLCFLPPELLTLPEPLTTPPATTKPSKAVTSSQLPSPKLSQETPLLLSSRRSILPTQLHTPASFLCTDLCLASTPWAWALTSSSPLCSRTTQTSRGLLLYSTPRGSSGSMGLIKSQAELLGRTGRAGSSPAQVQAQEQAAVTSPHSVLSSETPLRIRHICTQTPLPIPHKTWNSINMLRWQSTISQGRKMPATSTKIWEYFR